MNKFRSPELPLAPDVTTDEWSEIDEREVLDYDAETDTYWARIGQHPGCVPLEVVAVVAAVSHRPPLELPPLYDDIDTDCFDALADLKTADASMGDAHLSVTYVGHEVTVHGDGVISVRPPPSSSAGSP